MWWNIYYMLNNVRINNKEKNYLKICNNTDKK